MLKFNKILGYYRSGAVVFLIEDGRYAMTNVHHYSKASGGRVEISSNSICFLRGKEIKTNIPEEYEDKIKEILNNPNTKILTRIDFEINTAEDISKYFILDELAYIEGGYVLPPTDKDKNIDMKEIRESRKNKK